MENVVREDFEQKLERLGVPPTLADQVEGFPELSDVIIPVKFRTLFDEDVVNYKLYVQFNSLTELYDISRLDVSLRKPIDIPRAIVHGIDLHALDLAMEQIDWNDGSAAIDAHRSDVLGTLWNLSQNNHPVGIDLQEKLILKYLADTPYGEEIASLNKIRARHEIQRSFDLDSPFVFTLRQAYNLLRGRAVGVEVDQNGKGVFLWVGIDTLSKDLAGMPVLQVYENSQHFYILSALVRSKYGPGLSSDTLDMAIRSLQEGNPTTIPTIVDGKEGIVILKAEPWNDQVTEDTVEMKRVGLMEVYDREAAIAHQSDEKEDMIKEILFRLSFYGFDEVNEQVIRSGVYDNDPIILVGADKQFGEDAVHYTVTVEWREGDGAYYVAGYEAALKKEIVLPYVEADQRIGEIENRFKDIDWSKDYFSREERKLRALDVVEGPKQAEVDMLMVDLEDVVYYFYDDTPLTDLLLYKYWAGTPNERQIPNASEIQSQFVTKASFDLFSYMGVDAGEAYQLLNGKLIPQSISTDLGHDLSPGYLVLKEVDSKVMLRWLHGPSEGQLLSQLGELQTLALKEPDEREDILRRLMVGEMITYVPAGLGGPAVSFKLVEWESSMQLLLFPANWGYGKVPDEDKLASLFEGLLQLGIPSAKMAILRNFRNGSPFFSLEYNRDILGDRVLYQADFRLTEQADCYDLEAMHVSLIKHINIPDININGLSESTGGLESHMRDIDWTARDYFQYDNDPHDVTPAGEQTISLHARTVFGELVELYESRDPKGKWIAEALYAKYLLNTANEGAVMGEESVRIQYEIKGSFTGEALLELTLDSMYNLVDGRSALAGLNAKGQQEWYRFNFGGMEEGKYPFLERTTGSIGVALEHLPLSEELSFEDTRRKLANGDAVDITVLLKGKEHAATVFADPVKGLLVFENLKVDSELGQFVSQGSNWGYRNMPIGEIGQYRDFQVHPVPINEKALKDILQQVDFLGIPGDYEVEATRLLQRGYPAFTLNFMEKLGPTTLKVAVPFRPDDAAPERWKAYKYQISSGEHGTEGVALTVGVAGEPLLPFNKALNVLTGRAVQLEDNIPSNEWYTLDTARRYPDGTLGLKKMTFPLAEVIRQIERLPLFDMASEATKQGFVKAIRMGSEIEAAYVSGSKEIKGWLFFDWNTQKVRFTKDGGPFHVGRQQDDGGQKENTGLGNGRGRKG